MAGAVSRARDTTQALALLQSVMDGDTDKMRTLIGQGAECGLLREDVDPLAIQMDGAGTPMFAMLNLHAPEKPLNAPLYFAALRGDEAAFDLLLATTPFDGETLNVALYGAVAAGARNIAAKLIGHGADVNVGAPDCVTLSITVKRDDITQMLLKAGASAGAALAASIDHGRTDNVIRLLAQEAEPALGLAAICRQLSEFSAARNRRRDSDYLDAFDLIVSYATGHGDDIGQLLDVTLSRAIECGAASIIENILDHPAFAAQSLQLDSALSVLVRAAELRLDFGVRERCESLSEKLLERGADPQAVLETGAAAGSLALVMAALQRGADPRRHGRKSLSVSDTREVTKLLSEAERQLDERDFQAFIAQGPLTTARLHQPAEGLARDGLSVAAAGGRFADALGILQRDGQALTAAQLLRQNEDGTCALDLICARGQAGLLLDPSLWELRETEYRTIYEKMPAPARVELAGQHAETQARLQSCRTAAILKQQAEAHRKRFRLK